MKDRVEYSTTVAVHLLLFSLTLCVCNIHTNHHIKVT